jgi:tRNA-specific 2-thiouridylase
LIKFDLFLDEAIKLWCDYVATGHYARLLSHENIIRSKRLFRWLDHTKDQSYFLARLSQYQLDHAIFPLGELTKIQVREIAQEIWLPNADRPDSQWLCFIGDVPMMEFLKKKLPEQSWAILDATWKKIWTHKGARFYTLGQRHQLFLPQRAYVTAIDITDNTITVGDRDDKKLLSDTVSVRDRTWTWDYVSHDDLKSCTVKIRYRQDPPVSVICDISPEKIAASDDQIDFTFTEGPIRWVTPGQILVAYRWNGQILWSGIIV